MCEKSGYSPTIEGGDSMITIEEVANITEWLEYIGCNASDIKNFFLFVANKTKDKTVSGKIQPDNK
jgi:hypothetical protein